MNEWHRSMRRTGSVSAEQIASANIHAYVGIAILLLVALRLVLRFYQGAPPAPSKEPAVFRWAAKVAHVVLYALLLLMPVTGMASYYLGYESIGGFHADILKVVLWAVLGAHVVGVFVHQFYWKTNVLRRMTVG